MGEGLQDRLILYLIYLLGTATLMVLLLVLGSRVRHNLRLQRRQRVSQRLGVLLAEYINDPYLMEELWERLVRESRGRWRKQILLQHVTELAYNLTGVYFDRVQEAYYSFGLQRVSVRKLKSRRWDRVVEGMTELAILEADEGFDLIKPMLESRVRPIRRQARLALVTLDKAEGLMAMERQLGSMSNWTYISILSILQRSAFKLNAEQLHQLSTSKNPSSRRLAERIGKFVVTS